jgi:dihydroorotase-like cyclic amidohydrolase
VSLQEMVIRGGTVVTAYGSKEADIWIADGKIRRVAKDTLVKRTEAPPPIEIDATGMYLLPGFIAMPDQPLSRLKEMDPYKEAMRSLVKMGYTSLVDTFYPESWMDMPQVKYQQAIHFNSPIDYVWRVGLDASRFHGKKMQKWSAEGFSTVQISIRKPEEISSLNWETISQQLASYKSILHLHIPLDASLTREVRERIREDWMASARYWKLRTVISDLALPLPTTGVDPYYHIFRLKGDGTDRAVRHIYRNWFDAWPVAATLHDMRIDYRRRWCTEAELLCLLVRLASTNVAKTVGLYPRKGSLTPGADADILFLKKENWLTKHDLSTILNFSEWQLPTSVMSNGKWIYLDMRFISCIGMGKRLFDIKPYAYVI